jgi:hypothetical protein
MGVLLKALAPPTAHSAKKTDLYAEIKDRIDGCILPKQLDEVVEYLDATEHLLPHGWRDAFNDMIEVQREQIAAEDIGEILRSRFDF